MNITRLGYKNTAPIFLVEFQIFFVFFQIFADFGFFSFPSEQTFFFVTKKLARLAPSAFKNSFYFTTHFQFTFYAVLK